MGITITKLASGDVEVSGNGQPYTLSQEMYLYRDKSVADGVAIVSNKSLKAYFSASNVDSISGGSGVINNPTGDELYNELRDYFFFEGIEGITPGWDLYFDTNAVGDAYTANEIVSITDNTASIISFEDLTGVDIQTVVGTITLVKSGNNLVATNIGTLQYLELDNGSSFVISEGAYADSSNGGIYLFDSNRSNAFDAITTWFNPSTGLNTASDTTQIALQGWNKLSNKYSYSEDFNNADWVKHASIVVTNVVDSSPIGNSQVVRLQGSGAWYLAQYLTPMVIGDYRISFWVKSNTGSSQDFRYVYRNDFATDDLTATTEWQQFTFDFNAPTQQNNRLNGIISDLAENDGDLLITRPSVYLINESDGYLKTTTKRIEDGQVLTLTEDLNNLGNDLMGNPIINRPKLIDGFNFKSSLNHRVKSASILERNNVLGDSDELFIKAKSNTLQNLYGDDKLNIVSDVNGRLKVSYNGQTMDAGHLPTDRWLYLAHAVNPTGLRTLYIGYDESTPILFDTLQAATFLQASTEVLKVGNVDDASNAIDGYETQIVHYAKELTEAEYVNNSKVGSSKIEGKPPTIIGNTCVIGDSTIAAYLGQNAVASYLNVTGTLTDVSNPGDTIVEQTTAWINLSTSIKSNANYVFIQIGLNDIAPADDINTTLSSYQSLVDLVISDNPTAIIIAATMTPVKQRLIDLYGAVNGAASYQKWLDINNAIRGLHTTNINNLNGFVDEHTNLLNDGNGNLLTPYNTGDNVHETNQARQIIANTWSFGV